MDLISPSFVLQNIQHWKDYLDKQIAQPGLESRTTDRCIEGIVLANASLHILHWLFMLLRPILNYVTTNLEVVSHPDGNCQAGHDGPCGDDGQDSVEDSPGSQR